MRTRAFRSQPTGPTRVAGARRLRVTRTSTELPLRARGTLAGRRKVGGAPERPRGTRVLMYRDRSRLAEMALRARTLNLGTGAAERASGARGALGPHRSGRGETSGRARPRQTPRAKTTGAARRFPVLRTLGTLHTIPTALRWTGCSCIRALEAVRAFETCRCGRGVRSCLKSARRTSLLVP